VSVSVSEPPATSTTTTTRSVDPELGPRRLKAAALPVDTFVADVHSQLLEFVPTAIDAIVQA
jgi:hypothetical protein